ncbi:DinB family protein [Limnohabitans sp.]|uniref:DinB family protein n=1 Tax=Limnohabitans sp. TaxID=1907725 RepID=UPI003341BA9D
MPDPSLKRSINGRHANPHSICGTTMTILHSLFAQKSWANNELFNVLATVTAEEHAEVVHTAVRMLNHIYVVDRIFQAHLLGEQHGYSATNTDTTPTLDNLQFSVAETDAWYENYARDASESHLGESIAFRFTDGDSGRMTREEMLMHVITHGSYHRGNVGQMLKFVFVAPPRDLYTKFLHVSEPSRRRA